MVSVRFWQGVVQGAAAVSGVPVAVAPTLPPPAGSAVAPAVTAALPGPVPDQLGIASPWAPVSPELSRIIYSDIYGTDTARSLLPLSRDTGMAVPALARARHILCGTVAGLPLQLWAGDVQRPQPGWMRTTEPGISAWHRMLWTMDDQLFYGWSLWEVDRAGNDPNGPLVADSAPRRIARHRWEFEADTGRVLVDGAPMPNHRALLLPGPHEGLLTFARVPISQAYELEATATKVAQNPAAYLNLHYEGDAPMDEDKVDALIARWAAARRGENGGVAFTGPGLTATEMGSAAEHLLIEGRNAAAVNMARVASMPASLVDATTAGASLTYETTAGRNAELIDYGVDLYVQAIAARLSMDDVVPAGESVRMDTTQLRTVTPSPTGPITQD